MTLAFAGPDQGYEEGFLRQHRRESLAPVRFAILTAAVLVALFGLQDALLPRDQRLFTWGIRYLALLPVSLALWVASFRESVARRMPALVVAALVLYGLGFVAMVLKVTGSASHVYYTGLILLLMYCHTLLRLRFLQASLAGLLVVAAYEVAVLAFTATPAPVVINNTFFLLGATVIGMLASYGLERSARRNYYLGRRLAAEQEKVVSANLLLESRIQERTRELEEKNAALAREIADRERLEAERLALERHLLHAQKMESLGVLAGGIAHDFNNLLLAITGNAEMVQRRLDAGHPGHGFVDRLLAGASRARHLVQQILAFSRQQPTSRKVLEIADVVQDALELVQASAPPRVEILLDLAPEPLHVSADPTQLEQVLMNLVTNAFQAMPQGGTLTLGSRRLETRPARHPHLPEGAYVALAVSDTGPGMAPEVMERIFEPFFSTKPQGTGLGLAVAYGLAAAHGGALSAASEPGRGSTFELVLPLTEALAEPLAEADAGLPQASQGRILLVDDQDPSLEVQRMMLEEMGYAVTAHTSPVRAREAFLADPSAFDVVVSDYSMPSLTGLELAAALTARRPGLPFLLVTGFEDFQGSRDLAKVGVSELLPKPFRMADLAAAMARITAPVG